MLILPSLLAGFVTVSVLFELFSGPWGPSPSAILNRPISIQSFPTDEFLYPANSPNIHSTSFSGIPLSFSSRHQVENYCLETCTFPPTQNPLFHDKE